MAGGRPTKLTPEIIKLAKTYIKWCEDNPILAGKTKETTGDNETQVKEQQIFPRLPTIAGLARHIGVNRDTVYEWAKKDKEFSDIKDDVDVANEDILWAQGGAGTLSPIITRLGLAHKGYREKSDVTTDGKELPTPIYGGKSKT